MTASFDLIITGATVVLPGRTVKADIGVAGGRIGNIGDLDTKQAADVFVANGLHVLPGIIDTHVHFREPGFPEDEDLETGSRAAVLGGVTAVFEMPNTNPPTVSADTLIGKLGLAQGRMFCDYAFYIGGTAANAGEVDALEKLAGCAGIKVFMGSSTGTLLVDDVETLRRIVQKLGRRAAFHCEDEARLRERKHLALQGHPEMHPQWRDGTAAFLATQRLLDLASELGRKVHVLHVTAAEEMGLLGKRKTGDLVSVEVTPHHLILAAPEAYERLGTRAQTNPPIRDIRHCDALWAGIADGTVDVLGSDHAPHTLEEKDRPYPQSPSGMPGVQTLVPVMLDCVNAGKLTLERFCELASTAPARLFGLPGRGSIELDAQANFTVVDMQADREITNAAMASRCRWTPYDGMRVKGWPVATVIRGRVAMLDGAIMSPPLGVPIEFEP